MEKESLSLDDMENLKRLNESDRQYFEKQILKSTKNGKSILRSILSWLRSNYDFKCKIQGKEPETFIDNYQISNSPYSVLMDQEFYDNLPKIREIIGWSDYDASKREYEECTPDEKVLLKQHQDLVLELGQLKELKKKLKKKL